MPMLLIVHLLKAGCKALGSTYCMMLKGEWGSKAFQSSLGYPAVISISTTSLRFSTVSLGDSGSQVQCLLASECQCAVCAGIAF